MPIARNPKPNRPRPRAFSPFIAAVASWSATWLLPNANAWAFTDTQAHWANACITQLSEQKLVSGYPNGTFRPNATVTRAEFAVFMLNVFPKAEVRRQPIAFTDVPQAHWASSAIQKAYSRAFFSGYPDRTFRPAQPIPRVQAIAVLADGYNAQLGTPYPPLEGDPAPYLRKMYDDAAQIPAYAQKAIALATLDRMAIVTPNSRQLRPNDAITRADVAALACLARDFEETIPPAYIPGSSQFAIAPEIGFSGEVSEGLSPVKIGDRFGYIDTQGKLKISSQFLSATVFSQGLAIVGVKDGYQIIDRAGQPKVMLPTSEFLSYFPAPPGSFTIDISGFDSNGLIPVSMRGVLENGGEVALFGYLDRTGKWVVKPQDSIATFAEGLAAVEVNGKYGYVDVAGNAVIAPQFEEVGAFSQGLAPVKVGEQWGYIDRTGNIMIASQFASVAAFSHGLAAIQQNGKWGFIDRAGKLIVTPQFVEYRDFDGQLAAVKDNQNLWGYIDAAGAIVVEPKFREVRPFSEGLAAVYLGDSGWGYMNSSGQLVIAPQFNDAQPFSEGLAGVHLVPPKDKWENRWVYIDRAGKTAIALNFYAPEGISSSVDPISPFAEGLAAVRFGANVGYIDRTGKMVIEPQFADANSFSNGRAFVNVGGRWIGGTTGTNDYRETIHELSGGRWGYIRHPGVAGTS
jgi:S-layer homology domain/WG containing repeat